MEQHSSPKEHATTSPGDQGGMNLVEFANKYQSQFPVRLEVTRGYLNSGEDCSMSEGERFIAHFMKKSKVITIHDEHNEHFNIPLNSPFEFGLLHDPNKNHKEALSGFLFKTAGDMMLCRTLPKVVRARKGFRGISPEHSVEANDLLFVKEMVQKEGEMRYLRCTRAATGEERHFHENCAGHFSTTPYDVRMMLPDIVKQFQLPLKAVFYTNTDIDEEVPSYLISSVVTISSLKTEESLIATPLPEDEEEDIPPSDELTSQVNEIPLVFDVRVVQVPTRPVYIEQLLKSSEELYNSFDPSVVYPYLPKYSLTQYVLWKAIRKDKPMAGMELVPPPSVAKQQELMTKQSPASSAESLSEIVRMQVRLAKLEADQTQLTQNTEKSVNQSSPDVAALQPEVDKIKNEIRRLRQEMSTLTSSVTG